MPTTPDHFDLVVVGGGPAGVSAALRGAELGADTLLAEADRLGGTCVHHGCVPTRVLAKAARLAREVDDAADYGIVAAVERVVWPDLVARVRKAIAEVHDAKRSETRLRDAGVELVEGRASFTGRRRLAVASPNGAPDRTITADGVVLCVGGRARRPPFPGAERAVLPNEVPDLERLPERVVIVGSGNTGVQLATIFRSFGAEVDIIEMAPRLLPTADADVADHLRRAFVEQGVGLHLGTRVERIDAGGPGAGGGEGHVVRTAAEGSDGEALEADVVVLAAGWPAHVEGLGLEHAGVTVERGAIPVDGFFRSSAEGVYAAGDANGQHMLVQSAEHEGVAAATNAVLGPNSRAEHALLPWGGFTNPDIAGVGMTEDAVRERGAHVRVARVDYAELERPIIDGRTRGMLKLLSDPERRTILGAHAVGEQAVEVIQAVATAMAANTDVATLARVEYAYPSYTALLGRAAQRLLRE